MPIGSKLGLLDGINDSSVLGLLSSFIDSRFLGLREGLELG